MGEKYFKSSYYNYIYKRDNILLLYNILSGALAHIKKRDKKVIIEMLENPNNFVLRNNNKKIFTRMVQQGYIVEKNCDELNFVRFRYFKGAFSVKNISLILLPTRTCNFNCVYCFEKNVNDAMNELDCRNILRFLELELKKLEPKGISVAWYGGEPLLKFDIIMRLGKKILKIVNSFKISYDSSIVTNGYLLDESVAKELVKLGIKQIQITLDGPEAVHNKRRPLKNGNSTFKRVKNAIIIAQKYFSFVDIRINIDHQNIKIIPDFLAKNDWLYGKNTLVRPGRVRNYTEQCSFFSVNKIGLDAEEFYEIYNKIRGITRSRPQRIDTAFPNDIPIRSYYCGAHILNTYIIGPKSLVYKCTSHLNPTDEVGVIKDGKFYPNGKFLRYFFSKHPTEIEPCKSCKLLPLCMGGCQVVRKRCTSRDELKKSICDHSYILLNNFLAKASTSLKNKKFNK